MAQEKENKAYKNLKIHYIRCVDEYNGVIYQNITELSILSDAYYEYTDEERPMIYALLHERIEQIYKESKSFSKRLNQYHLNPQKILHVYAKQK